MMRFRRTSRFVSGWWCGCGEGDGSFMNDGEPWRAIAMMAEVLGRSLAVDLIKSRSCVEVEERSRSSGVAELAVDAESV